MTKVIEDAEGFKQGHNVTEFALFKNDCHGSMEHGLRRNNPGSWEAGD